jgi:RNA polymerase sigma-70 factor (ECF subfamily)
MMAQASVLQFIPTDEADAARRVDHLVRTELPFVWRLLRRLGLEPADADDAAQQVFIVAARSVRSIEVGRERAFLYSTAVRIASRSHRSRRRRREVGADTLGDLVSHTTDPERLTAQRQARELLDGVLAQMPMDARVVFVLFELEQLTMSEIACALKIPQGTVASRLRRGRAMFQASIAELETREPHRGGLP